MKEVGSVLKRKMLNNHYVDQSNFTTRPPSHASHPWQYSDRWAWIEVNMPSHN